MRSRASNKSSVLVQVSTAAQASIGLSCEDPLHSNTRLSNPGDRVDTNVVPLKELFTQGGATAILIAQAYQSLASRVQSLEDAVSTEHRHVCSRPTWIPSRCNLYKS